jgi:hypothetical protein
VRVVANPVPGKPPPSEMTATSSPLEGSSGVYTAALQLAPGNYGVSASSRNCQTPATTDMAIFPGKVRHVTLVLSRQCCEITTATSNASIAVSTTGGVSAAVISTTRLNLPQLTGKRDGSIVYFDSLAPDKYILMLYASGVAACIPFEIPSGYAQLQRYFDLSVQTSASLFRAAAARPLASLHSCTASPSSAGQPGR